MTRLVCTSDTHFPFDVDKIPSGDIFIHAGDLMYSGYPSEWKERLDCLAALDFKKKILVPGNHDFHIQNYTGIARAELRRAGVTLVDDTAPIIEVNGLTILGMPFVTGLSGWAYNRDEEYITNWLDTLGIVSPDIVVSHAPIYGTLDAVRPEQKSFYNQVRVGSRAYNRWLVSQGTKPKAWIHGHIHESYGLSLAGQTAVYNVAMCDRNYEQVNKPMVIDI